jgi:cysteine-rich repeat protein
MRVGPRGGDAASWSWGLALVGVGPAGAASAVAPAKPLAAGNRIEYRRPGLTEWYVNDRRGLEHGFTFPEAPPGNPDRLELVLELEGSLIPLVGDPEDGLTLRDAAGATVLGYDGLHALDATGRTLAARMELDPARGGARRLRIGVDVAGALYPVTIDPLISTEVQELVRPAPAVGDEFGVSAALSGHTAVVGAHREDVVGIDSGSAYVFERNQGGVADNWGLVKELTAPEVAAGDLFGTSVSISVDTIVVGALASDDVGSDSGSAYVFERNMGGGDNWGKVKRLVASDASPNDLFGSAVAIDGDTIAVGAHDAGVDGVSEPGAVYVFERNKDGVNNWGEVRKRTASDAVDGDGLGIAISISGDTIVAGAYGQDDGGTDAGAAYVFVRNEGGADNWGEVAKLVAADAAAGDRFGHSVSVSGDTIVAGADTDDHAGGADAGSAYVFARNTGGADDWGEVKRLSAADPSAGDRFGRAVSISDSMIVVGAHLADSPGADSGAAYVFERNAGGADNWGQIHELAAGDGAAGDRLGVSAAISGDTIVLGSELADVDAVDSGSAYIFTIAGCEWNEVAEAVPADPGTGDGYGRSVSISGDTLVVGAWQEDAAGVDAGAAYVFERNQGGLDHWGQVTKLTASDAAAGDHFGNSVSISGDTVVVGADDNDDAGTSSGSAYVFARNTGGADNWGEAKKLTAVDAAGGDNFGWSVSISGDTVVVGAYGNDDTGSASGSTYVFERNKDGQDNWGQVKKLSAADAAAGDEFGISVSIRGDTLVVGAWQDDAAGADSGSAYVFERNAGGVADGWGQVRKLTAADSAAGDVFGWSVAIDGDTLVVGAYGDDDAGSFSGSAYVFERNGHGPNGWSEAQKLVAANAAADDFFGTDVSISGDTVAVGLFIAGSAYVFERNQGGLDNWGQVQELTTADAAAGDYFGRSVSISGDTIVVGSTPDAGPVIGSAHVFNFNCPVCGDGLQESPEGCDEGAENSDVEPDACRTDCTVPSCGDDVTDSGEVCDDAAESASCNADCSLPACGDGRWNALAGEACDDGNTIGDDGCTADCSLVCPWSELAKTVAADAAPNDSFGSYVSMRGDVAVVGA